MNTKYFWQSKTIQGLFITLLGSTLIFLGEQNIISDATLQFASKVLGWLADILGVAYAFYGRTVTTGAKLVLTNDKPE